jgi:hypothetical protein
LASAISFSCLQAPSSSDERPEQVPVVGAGHAVHVVALGERDQLLVLAGAIEQRVVAVHVQVDKVARGGS